MKTPNGRGSNPYILSADRVYAASQVLPQASGDSVLHWLSAIDQADADSERTQGSNLHNQKSQRPESLGVQQPPAIPPKLVNDKWPHLRPKQVGRFQRSRRISDRPEKTFLQLDVHVAEALRARKLNLSMKMRKPRSRDRKRKRRSVLDDPFASWNASMGVTLDRNLLLDRGGAREPQELRYARLVNLRIDKVDAEELASFTSLFNLDLSDNRISMELLTTLSTLQKLTLQCNGISKVELKDGSFALLEVLDLSYNFLISPAMLPLSTLPKLRKLNIDNNNVSNILEAGIVETSFPSLERLYAAGNGLSAQSLLSLSKLPKLERLYVRENNVASIPEQLGSDNYKFPLLQVLDLASNPVKDHSSLTSLRRIERLRKVKLWGTPLASKVGYDLNGKCLPIARPILLAAMQAQKEGQHWMLYKPISAGDEQLDQPEEVLSHVVPKLKAYRPVLFPDEKMVEVFDKVYQQAKGIDSDSGALTTRSIEETVLGGSSSMSKPFAEGMENHVAISQQSGQPQKADRPKLPAFAPMLMEEELKKLQDTKIPVDPYPKDPKAHLTSLKLALQMIPFRGVDEEIDPPSYRMPTRLNKIQEHKTRLDLQAPISARKRALFIARRFADRAEREAREQVRNKLEKLGHQLKYMKTRISDINNLAQAPGPIMDTLTDDEAGP